MKYFIKPLSVTSNEFIEYLKREKKIKDKACYCGRLDPMARGKMLILEGNDCKKMPNYLNNDKCYEFIIVFGNLGFYFCKVITKLLQNIKD